MKKEYPQEECTNCNRNSSSWCVCAKCRKNGDIVNRLIQSHNQLVELNKKWKFKLGSGGQQQLHLTSFCLTGKLNSPKRKIKK